MLEKLPSLITALTIAALAIAISHEWAYFSVIGPELQALFTTSDYIALVIWGTGAAFLTIIVFGLLHFLAYRSDGFKVPPFSKDTTFWGFVDRHFNLIFLGIAAVLASFFGRSQINLWAYGFFTLLVMRALLYIFSHEKLKDYDRAPLSIAIYGIPVGMMLSYGLGEWRAYEDIGNVRTRYELRLNDQYVSRNVSVLRFLERGVIVFDPKTRTVEFVRNDAIARIATNTPQFDNRSFVCSRWNIMCMPQQPSETQAK